MAKALRTVAVVAGAAALIVATAGALAPVATASALASVGVTATATTVATVASAVAAAASLGSQLLTKKPPVQGAVNALTIGTNQPIPYGMGRSFVVGAQLHDAGYGGRVGKVDNPYLSKVWLWSGGGPIEAIEDFLVDWQSVGIAGDGGSGYYAGWLSIAYQHGYRPEAAALAGPHGSIPDWGPDRKLSGYAAGLLTLRFDRDGKVWANGVPVMGPVAKWARVYDRRKDGSAPGGAGGHRFGDENTFEWNANVALNAITYARGRYAVDGSGQQTLMILGCGFPEDSIDWPAWNGFANVCDANGWTVNGHVYDGPGLSRWDNLKRICATGGGEPCISGGKLSVKYQAPKVALDTITADDLADGEYVAPGMRTYRDRINSIVPRYRSEANKWELVSSEAVTNAAYVALDGEIKEEELALELVTDKDQAAQLGAYELVNRRELAGITLPCKPRLWEYRLGEALNVDLPELGIDHLCVIDAISKDVGSGVVTLTLTTETTAKHAFALGQTGSAPPPPTLLGHGESDEAAYNNAGGNDVIARAAYQIVRQSVPYPVTSTDDTITVAAFDATLDDGRQISFPAGSIGGLNAATGYIVLWDLTSSAYVVAPEPALMQVASSRYVIVRSIATADEDGTYPGGPTAPGGDGGGGYGGGYVGDGPIP